MLKVLLVCDPEGISYTEPLSSVPSDTWRARGIELDWIRSARPHLAAWYIKQPKYDASIVEDTLCSEEIFTENRRIIVYDRVDGSQFNSPGWLSRSLKQLRGYAVGYLKNYRLNPLSLYHLSRERYNVLLMQGNGVIPVGVLPPWCALTDQELSRVKLCHTFGAFSANRYLASHSVDFDAARKFSCCFIGRTDYPVPSLQRHRDLCVQRISECPGYIFWQRSKVPYGAYLEMMLNAQAVVSPWGYGEACLRDFEAVLCGAILIKPPMSHVDSNPNLYLPGETCFECRHDFADLPEIVARIERDWSNLRQMRESALVVARRAASLECVADVVSRSIKELLA